MSCLCVGSGGGFSYETKTSFGGSAFGSESGFGSSAFGGGSSFQEESNEPK